MAGPEGGGGGAGARWGAAGMAWVGASVTTGRSSEARRGRGDGPVGTGCAAAAGAGGAAGGAGTDAAAAGAAGPSRNWRSASFRSWSIVASPSRARFSNDCQRVSSQ